VVSHSHSVSELGVAYQEGSRVTSVHAPSESTEYALSDMALPTRGSGVGNGYWICRVASRIDVGVLGYQAVQPTLVQNTSLAKAMPTIRCTRRTNPGTSAIRTSLTQLSTNGAFAGGL
jgi:hypothetical protein